MPKKKLVVLTGAGISAESGLKTFRDAGGLWEGHNVYEVASPEGWYANPELVLEFYNQRRKQLLEVEPNPAHHALVELEDFFEVVIVTQNVDDLHERAGSQNIIHLHGELKKVRSTVYENLVYELPGWELKLGDNCEKGHQLRPHIVWFGESVPLIEDAALHCSDADLLAVIGTSMQVYPAAGLIHYASVQAPKFYIDPQAEPLHSVQNLRCIKQNASSGVPELVQYLKRDFL
ncbi:MAG: NAD-dependent deacylase [Bacteroidetes bacterium]|nr:MAG: NAD-dependent deacylase [Bacteroidota bacterium]